MGDISLGEKHQPHQHNPLDMARIFETTVVDQWCKETVVTSASLCSYFSVTHLVVWHNICFGGTCKIFKVLVIVLWHYIWKCMSLSRQLFSLRYSIPLLYECVTEILLYFRSKIVWCLFLWSVFIHIKDITGNIYLILQSSLVPECIECIWFVMMHLHNAHDAVLLCWLLGLTVSFNVISVFIGVSQACFSPSIPLQDEVMPLCTSWNCSTLLGYTDNLTYACRILWLC